LILAIPELVSGMLNRHGTFEDSSMEAWLLMLFLERVGQETIVEQLGSINKLNEGARLASPRQLRCDSYTTLNNDDRLVHVSSKRNT
jgi:hypothetical protein